MQNSKRLPIIVLTTALFALFTIPAGAQDSWWDKAKQLFSGDDTVKQFTLSDEQIASALKQALSIGSESVINTLQQQGAFANNPELHIALPPTLAKAGDMLETIGMGHWTNDLEAQLNAAAEQAIPAAGPIILAAIENLTLHDIRAIYQGESDAATQYFKAQMSEPISTAITPLIQQSLADVGALQLYDTIIAKYQTLPFVPDISADLTEHVKAKALSGIFEYLAKEEAAIRANPEKRTTELLQRVFSAG